MLQVRISLAGFGELQAAHENARSGVYRASDGLGAEQHR